MTLYHKHLLVNAKILNPFDEPQQGISFLTDLVDQIQMKILHPPVSHYVDKEGNKGLTGIVLIETSHIAFHIWDEPKPALLQFDLYTCGTLNFRKVLSIIQHTFNVVNINYIMFDRENGFQEEASGNTWGVVM
jgi:S-adenosylmethionine/arginine decarboxylase-like enzyme